MALRLGTGGLKYPIPVAPDAQQSIAAASAGGSAAASAYGSNRSFAANKMRVQADLANSAADRDFRARSQMEEQGFRARENFYDREHQAGAQLQGQEFRANQEELDRNFRAFQQQSGQNFQLNRDKAEMEFTRERDKTRFDREDAAIADEDAQLQTAIETGSLELNPQAQKKMDAIAAERSKMASDPQFTDEQRAEAEKKFREQERRIRRTAGKPRGPDATDQANSSQTFFDPQTGKYEREMGPGRIPGSVGQNGEFRPTVEAPDTSKEDQRRQSWIDKRADDLMKQENEDGKPLYTPEDAARMAMQDWDKRQKGFQPGAGPGGTWQGPPAAPGQTAPPPAPAPAQPAPPMAPAPGQPGSAPGQQAPPVPLPGKPVGPPPVPETLPTRPGDPVPAPVPLGSGLQPRPGVQPNVPRTQPNQTGAPPAPGSVEGGLGSRFVPPGQKPVDLNAPPPPPKPGPAGMGGSVQSRSGSYGEPPAGFPAGSKTIDFNTYLLPDGRIVRGKGK